MTRRTRADSWSLCKTPPARARRTSNQRFGETVQSGGAGGTGIGLYKGALYAEINDKIVRYALPAGSIVPRGPAVPIVTGLPLGGDHPMHPFAIDATVPCMSTSPRRPIPASRKTARRNRRASIRARNSRRAAASGATTRTRPNQAFSPAERFATGIRNAEGFAIDAAGHIFVTQHGRDQLHANWPDLYKPEEEATLPAEELLLLKQGGDYGWPECYYDAIQGKLVLAPEYGGDGGKKVGAVRDQERADRGVSGALGTQRHGVLRQAAVPGPLPQRRVHRLSRIVGSGALSPGRLQRGVPSLGGRSCLGPVRDICRRICGRGENRRTKPHIVRPASRSDPTARSMSPTMCADGSTASSIAADQALTARRGTDHALSQRIGARRQRSAPMTPNLRKALIPMPAPLPRPRACPFRQARPRRWSRSATASTTVRSAVRPARAAMARTRRAPPLGPDLTDTDGCGAMAATRRSQKPSPTGVPQPKQYRSPMPPMGGAQLTADQVSAVAAYVWALSHRSAAKPTTSTTSKTSATAVAVSAS